MNSLRKWLYKPRKNDESLYAKFYWASEDVDSFTTHLDETIANRNPEQFASFLAQLRLAQDKMLKIAFQIMEENIPGSPMCREFRIKYPEEIAFDAYLDGHIWFSAENLIYGTRSDDEELQDIREFAGKYMKALQNMISVLKAQALMNQKEFPSKVCKALKDFDSASADFEFKFIERNYNIKTDKEYYLQQDITVLFSESLQRALSSGLVSLDLVESCCPSLMFTIPRLAIYYGLSLYSDGPLNLSKGADSLSLLFKPHFSKLTSLKNRIRKLSSQDKSLLESELCSQGDAPPILPNPVPKNEPPNTLNLMWLRCPTRGEEKPAPQPESSPDESSDISISLNSSPVSNRNVTTSNRINRQTEVHKLFTYISLIADQLQSNHAGDIRQILKNVFAIANYEPSSSNSSESNDSLPPSLEDDDETEVEDEEDDEKPSDDSIEIAEEAIPGSFSILSADQERPTEWIPDELATTCSKCKTPFTFFLRRHHCRACGQIFCYKCSNNFIQLRSRGSMRVCDYCLPPHLHR